MFIAPLFEIRENSYCSSFDSEFSTLADAKRQCIDDPLCEMFYDAGGIHIEFRLCGEGSTIATSSVGSILYSKTSECMSMYSSYLYVTNHNMVNINKPGPVVISYSVSIEV